jgi:hypothetical protein
MREILLANDATEGLHVVLLVGHGKEALHEHVVVFHGPRGRETNKNRFAVLRSGPSLLDGDK